jgi:Prokaryotic Cytochrome C oxidase subunit IV
MLRNPFASPFKVWAALMLMTLASFLVFEGHFLGSASSLVIAVIAGYKSRLVILHFMEATHAPTHFRFLYETWNFVVVAIIVIGSYVQAVP